MTDQIENDLEKPTPTEINLHRKSRLLQVNFSDGRSYQLPCEYLRVFSRAAEEQIGGPITGKELVNIDSIEPQGNYAIRIIFDDGHDTSIYSWETLHELGENQDKNWTSYLEQLERLGYSRQEATGADQRIRIRVLYFAYLAKLMRKESEDITLPAGINTVESFLSWHRKREKERSYLLEDDKIQVTVNRSFAKPFTRLEAGDEVAIVPNSPTPPAGPN